MKRQKKEKFQLPSNRVKMIALRCLEHAKKNNSWEGAEQFVRNYCEKVFKFRPAKNFPNLIIEKAKEIERNQNKK